MKRKSGVDRGNHARVSCFKLATSLRDRTRGLLLTSPHSNDILLMPCRDVHTMGMRQRVDIAFVDRFGRVLEVHRSVGPKTRLRNRRAAATIERFSSAAPWFKPGDRVGIGCIDETRA